MNSFSQVNQQTYPVKNPILHSNLYYTKTPQDSPMQNRVDTASQPTLKAAAKGVGSKPSTRQLKQVYQQDPNRFFNELVEGQAQTIEKQLMMIEKQQHMIQELYNKYFCQPSGKEKLQDSTNLDRPVSPPYMPVFSQEIRKEPISKENLFQSNPNNKESCALELVGKQSEIIENQQKMIEKQQGFIRLFATALNCYPAANPIIPPSSPEIASRVKKETSSDITFQNPQGPFFVDSDSESDECLLVLDEEQRRKGDDTASSPSDSAQVFSASDLLKDSESIYLESIQTGSLSSSSSSPFDA